MFTGSFGRLSSVIMHEIEDAVLVTPYETIYAYDVRDAQDFEYNSATGITKDVTYDDMGRPIVLNHFQDANENGVQDVGENTVALFTYTYDAAGNRTSAVESFDETGTPASGPFDHVQSFTWTYDALNRLIVEAFDSGNNQTADPVDYVTRFHFDAASNRIEMQKDAGNYDITTFVADEVTTYSYNANDQLETEIKDVLGTTDGDTNTTYAYDGTTQIEKTVREGITPGSGDVLEQVTQTYNVMVRLSTITTNKGTDSTVIEYEYDTRGLRVKATTIINGGTPDIVEYLFDTNNPTGYAQILEETLNGSLAKTYMLGHDVVAQFAAGELLTMLYDLHGSVRALIDMMGNIKDSTPGSVILFVFLALEIEFLKFFPRYF